MDYKLSLTIINYFIITNQYSSSILIIINQYHLVRLYNRAFVLS